MRSIGEAGQFNTYQGVLALNDDIGLPNEITKFHGLTLMEVILTLKKPKIQPLVGMKFRSAAALFVKVLEIPLFSAF